LQTLRAITLDAAVHRIEQLVILKGLDKIIGGSSFHRPYGRTYAVMSGKKHERCFASNRCLSGLKIETAHSGQPHV